MTDVRIKRILRVNHAGEYGAIRIYNAQIMVAGLFYKDLVPFLAKMRDEEIIHLERFRDAMPSRQTRPCYTLWVWSWGGYALGLITACMGRNVIMVCTEAVEDSVHRHLNAQIEFLAGCDHGLQSLIESIKVEELDHLHYAQSHVRHSSFTKMIGKIIFRATDLMVWLSTQGASSRMKPDLQGL